MKAYHNTAFPLGAIKANIPNYEIWLCNRYINCIYGNPSYYPNLWKLESYYKDRWFSDDGTTHVQSMFLDASTFKSKGIDVITLNKEMLRENFYVNGCYNEYFIKGKSAYKKEDFIHDYIIFGYDDDTKSFKSAAYFPGGKYRFYDIPYEDYYNSIVGSKKECLETFYAKVNKDCSPKIDIKAIKESLNKYLYSEKETLIQHLQGYFGMEAWGKFAEYVKEAEYTDLDTRFSRVCMEHRQLMHMRIKKLYEQNYIADSTIEEEYYKKVCLPTVIIHNLFIKYNISKSTKLPIRIYNIIQKTNLYEVQIIERLINAIKL